MYLALHDLGDENLKILDQMENATEKWSHIAHIASDFGVHGIQISPYYRKWGFELTSIPHQLKDKFLLTYHLGGIYPICDQESKQKLDGVIANSLEIAAKNGMKDVSLHPPCFLDKTITPELRAQSKKVFMSLLKEWLPRFLAQKITFSLETHVTSSVFTFDGIHDFRDFVLELPGLDILIDVSHNYYDGYDIQDLLSILQPLTITGFHLSDSIRGVELGEGTHLPLGKGNIDFKIIADRFNPDNTVYGAFEVRGSSEGITKSITHMKALSGLTAA